MTFNNTFLCLRLEDDGILYDEYSNLAIKSNKEMSNPKGHCRYRAITLPTDVLILHINNYYKYKEYLDNDLVLNIEVNNYRICYVDEYRGIVSFINNNCNYEIYGYCNYNNVFGQENLEGNEYKIVLFSLEDIVKKIKGPCIVRDFSICLSWYKKINNVDQLHLSPYGRRRFMEIDTIYKRFTFKQLTYYNYGSSTNNDGHCIMDVRTNFCTKKAVKL